MQIFDAYLDLQCLVLVFFSVTTSFCRQVVCSHYHKEEKQKKERGEEPRSAAPYHSTELIPEGKSFLCRKQSQLCRVRIRSQWERGGRYDVSPTPPPPFVRNRRAEREAGETGEAEVKVETEKCFKKRQQHT